MNKQERSKTRHAERVANMPDAIQAQQMFEMEIETLIDKYSVSGILNAMANVCYAKAEHIRENWQDNDLAKDWEKRGSKIARIILI